MEASPSAVRSNQHQHTETFTTFVREMSKHTTVIVDEAEERDEPAIWRLGVDPRGMSFTGSLQNATRRHQIGRARPIGECTATSFGRRCLSTSVRLSSITPSEYRQRIAKIPVILKALKISTKYVGNSVENSKPVKSDRCLALTFLVFAQILGNHLNY